MRIGSAAVAIKNTIHKRFFPHVRVFPHETTRDLSLRFMALILCPAFLAAFELREPRSDILDLFFQPFDVIARGYVHLLEHG